MSFKAFWKGLLEKIFGGPGEVIKPEEKSVETTPEPKPEPIVEEKLIEKIPEPEADPEPVEEVPESNPESKGDSPIKPEILEETMYPAGIKDYEKQFDTTHKDSDGVKYTVTRNTDYTFPLSILKPKGITDYYYTEEHEKTAIVLHFTVGYLTGDLATLIEQSSHMSVPYVIGRNGTVYQLFDPKYWAYHLGRGTVGGNTVNSKRTIAIELSNIGPLSRDNAKELSSIYGSRYCDIVEKDYYTKLQTTYRKYSYYATFTDKQYETLSQLISYLCGKFNIPKRLIAEDQRYNIFNSAEEATSFKGICSHVNFRAYGKVDIGPAFKWSCIS